MKKNLILATLLTVMSVAVFANNSEIVYDSTSVFKVYYTGKTPSNVKVTILNAEGKKVFSEIIKNKDGFMRPYNMNDMEAGAYTFEINDGTTVEVYDFNYNLPKEEKTMGVNIQKLATDKYLFMLGAFEKAEVKIHIIDAKGNLVYEAKEEVKSQFSQVFNLKKVNADSYTFNVYRNGSLIKSTSL